MPLILLFKFFTMSTDCSAMLPSTELCHGVYHLVYISILQTAFR
jgi:hypothetical protein